jgi:hypothetical protein
MSAKDQLVIPDAAESDPNSIELVRVWVANKGQHVSLKTGVWEDPFAWGMMLADLAKHVSKAYAMTANMDAAQALARVKAGFAAETGMPTDEPKGGILGRVFGRKS